MKYLYLFLTAFIIASCNNIDQNIDRIRIVKLKNDNKDTIIVTDQNEKQIIMKSIESRVSEFRIFSGVYKIEVFYNNGKQSIFLINGKYLKTEGYTYRMDFDLSNWVKDKYYKH